MNLKTLTMCALLASSAFFTSCEGDSSTNVDTSAQQDTDPYNRDIDNFSEYSSRTQLSSSSNVDTTITTPEDDVFSCLFETTGEFMGIEIDDKVCYELDSKDAEEVSDECVSMEEMGLTMTATTGTGCPSGAVVSCEDTNDGITGTTYYYSDDYIGMTCDDITAQQEEL